MARPRKSRLTREVEITEEVFVEEVLEVECYKFAPPCSVEMESKDFEPKKMAPYNWENKGIVIRDQKRMLCLRILGEK